MKKRMSYIFKLILWEAFFFVLVSLTNVPAWGITISITPADEEYKLLADQATYDLCSRLYDCAHTKTGSRIVVATPNFSAMFQSVRAKNSGLTLSSYDYANLHAARVGWATDSYHAVNSGWAVWADQSNSVNTSSEIFTANTITTADVEMAETVRRVPYVEYARTARYAEGTHAANVVHKLRKYLIHQYYNGWVSLGHYTKRTYSVGSTSPIVKHTTRSKQIVINDNSTSY